MYYNIKAVRFQYPTTFDVFNSIWSIISQNLLITAISSQFNYSNQYICQCIYKIKTGIIERLYNYCTKQTADIKRYNIYSPFFLYNPPKFHNPPPTDLKIRSNL